MVGAGAIGLLVGGRLLRAGHDVTLVVRPSMEQQLRATGLRLMDGREYTIQSPHLATSVAAAAGMGEYDWLALTIKAYDVAGAAEEIRAAFATPPPVATFQNGLGSEEEAAGVLATDRLVSVTVTIPVSVPGPGAIEARKKGGFGVAAFAPAARGDAQRVLEALRSTGSDTIRYDDYPAMKWSKLLTNMMGNASSAILDMPPEDIYADPRLFRMELTALREAVAVMQAWHIPAVDLPGLRVTLLAWVVPTAPSGVLRRVLTRMIRGGRGGKMPSLHLDLVGGKGQSEVAYLNGAVVDWGERKGIATPVNRALTQTLLGLTNGSLDWATFRQRPDALLRLVFPDGV